MTLTHEPTASQLKSALLAVRDLPSGYVVELQGTNPSGKNTCPQVTGSSPEPEAKEVFIAFVSSRTVGNVTFVIERLVGSTLSGARVIFSHWVSGTRKCERPAFADSKVKMAIRLASENFAKVASQAIAWQVTGTLTESGVGIPISGEMVLIQDGYVDIELDNLRLVLPGDTTLTRQAAARAVAKVGSIRG